MEIKINIKLFFIIFLIILFFNNDNGFEDKLSISGYLSMALKKNIFSVLAQKANKLESAFRKRYIKNDIFDAANYIKDKSINSIKDIHSTNINLSNNFIDTIKNTINNNIVKYNATLKNKYLLAYISTKAAAFALMKEKVYSKVFQIDQIY
jgi:hypothetical protein